MTRLSLIAILAAACGGLPAPNYAPPLVTLFGTVTPSQLVLTPPPSSLRMAVVWPLAGTNNEGDSVAFDLGSPAQFPVQFQFPVTAPPPATAMKDADPADLAGLGLGAASFRWAVGNLILYRDANGNGRLDLDGGDFIYGQSNSLLYYVEGTPPAPDANGFIQLKTGFNWMDFSAATRTVPISSSVEIPLSGFEEPNNRALCSSHLASGPPPTGAVNDAPAIPNAVIGCAPSGFEYFWQLCTGTLCDESCQYGSQVRTSPPPPGWPCAANQP